MSRYAKYFEVINQVTFHCIRQEGNNRFLAQALFNFARNQHKTKLLLQLFYFSCSNDIFRSTVYACVYLIFSIHFISFTEISELSDPKISSNVVLENRQKAKQVFSYLLHQTQSTGPLTHMLELKRGKTLTIFPSRGI